MMQRIFFVKKILLINEDGEQRWLDEKTNGSIWCGEEEYFSSETEAIKKGWKVDAVKVLFESTDGKEGEGSQ